MLAAMDDVLSSVSQFLVLFSLIPAGYFVIDYVVVRPFLTGRDINGQKRKRYAPWWKSGIGVMFAMLGSSIFFTDVVITLSLWLGPDYPARQIVRVLLYGYCAVAITVLAVVYGVEGSKHRSVLMGKED